MGVSTCLYPIQRQYPGLHPLFHSSTATASLASHHSVRVIGLGLFTFCVCQQLNPCTLFISTIIVLTLIFCTAILQLYHRLRFTTINLSTVISFHKNIFCLNNRYSHFIYFPHIISLLLFYFFNFFKGLHNTTVAFVSWILLNTA